MVVVVRLGRSGWSLQNPLRHPSTVSVPVAIASASLSNLQASLAPFSVALGLFVVIIHVLQQKKDLCAVVY